MNEGSSLTCYNAQFLDSLLLRTESHLLGVKCSPKETNFEKAFGFLIFSLSMTASSQNKFDRPCDPRKKFSSIHIWSVIFIHNNRTIVWWSFGDARAVSMRSVGSWCSESSRHDSLVPAPLFYDQRQLMNANEDTSLSNLGVNNRLFVRIFLCRMNFRTLPNHFR